MGDLSAVGEREGLSTISREDQQYVRIVSYGFRGPAKLAQRTHESFMMSVTVPAGSVVGDAGFDWGYVDDSDRGLWLVFGVGVILVVLAVAMVFDSVWAAAMVLLSIPLALAGVMAAFWIAKTPFTREAAVGVILVVGLAVHQGILLVDAALERRRARAARGGRATLRARDVTDAALERAAMIVLVTLSTLASLIPRHRYRHRKPLRRDRAGDGGWHGGGNRGGDARAAGDADGTTDERRGVGIGTQRVALGLGCTAGLRLRRRTPGAPSASAMRSSERPESRSAAPPGRGSTTSRVRECVRARQAGGGEPADMGIQATSSAPRVRRRSEFCEVVGYPRHPGRLLLRPLPITQRYLPNENWCRPRGQPRYLSPEPSTTDPCTAPHGTWSDRP